jgi:CBS-domain-containing membrane protein
MLARTASRLCRPDLDMMRKNARLAATSFVYCAVVMLFFAGLAVAGGQHFLFPPMGASAFLHGFAPQLPVSSPRNTILGHLIGSSTSFASLAAFGLLEERGAPPPEFGVSHVACVALAMGATAALMVFFNVPHPPAGATALVVSMGIMPRLAHWPIIMASASMLCVLTWLRCRATGEYYPLWHAHDHHPQPPLRAQGAGATAGGAGQGRAPGGAEAQVPPPSTPTALNSATQDSEAPDVEPLPNPVLMEFQLTPRSIAH